VIDELRKTVYMAHVQLPGATAELALLRDHRDRLNNYCEAVNEPVSQSGETPSSIYGKLLLAAEQLDGMELPLFRFNDCLKWTPEKVARKRALVERLRDALVRSGPIRSHPYCGSDKRSYVPTERESLARALRRVSDALMAVGAKSAALAALFNVPAPESFQEVEVLVCAARLIASSPDLAGIDAQHSGWLQYSSEIVSADIKQPQKRRF
jgi:hypothetical protein